MAELYRYVAAELGGQHYRVIVLGSQDHPVYEGRLAVAMPPKLAGRFIDREEWDSAMGGRQRGTQSMRSSTTTTTAAPTQQQGQHDTLLSTLVQLVFKSQQDTAAATMQAVRDISASTRDLVREVVQHRDNETSRGSLSEQLGEFAATSRAVQRIGRAFGAASAPAGGDDDGSPLQKAAEQAFLSQVMGSMVGGGNHRSGPVQPPGMIPTSRPIPVRPQK